MEGDSVEKPKRKKPVPVKTRVRAALRQLWLRSPQRAEAIRRDGYTCQHCGARQSAAKGAEVKVVVHHIDEIDWDGVCELVIERVLQDPSRLTTLCVGCHKAVHKKGE